MDRRKGRVTPRSGEGGGGGELLEDNEEVYKSSNEGGDEVCFSCKDGGKLRFCDYRECPKLYHPECVDKDDNFLDSSEEFICRWHTCFICKGGSDFQCICCPDYSVCHSCMSGAQFVQVKSSIWPTNGFCINCLSTVLMIEKSVEVDSDGVKVDFDDSSTYEYLFKNYWKAVNKKERLPLDELQKDLDYLKIFSKEEQRKSKKKKIKEEGSEDDSGSCMKKIRRIENPQCPTCKDTKGLCGRGSKTENGFTLALPVGFESSLPIPCYIRERFLLHFSIRNFPTTFKAQLATKENFYFVVKVNNVSDVTTIYGNCWRKFIRMYQLKVGLELVFDFSTIACCMVATENPPILPASATACCMVAMGNLPILPASYYELTKPQRQLVDLMVNPDNMKLNWKQMNYVVNHVKSLNEPGNDQEGPRISVPMLHKLKKTHCLKEMKTFRLNILAGMDRSGTISIVYEDQPAVTSTYKIITDDRMSLDGWNDVMARNAHLKTGDLLLFTLYKPSFGLYLVVHDVPKIELE